MHWNHRPATIFGPDISNNNGVVDLDRVKAEGFDFVWAKVSEGTSFRDTYWPRTRDWARENRPDPCWLSLHPRE